MERADYKEYTISTIKGYPHKYRRYLQEQFVKEGIAQECAQVSIENPNAIDITGYDIDEALIKCIEDNEKSLSIFEKWEFYKDYKYSVLFVSDEFDSLVQNVKEKTDQYNNDASPLYSRFEQPNYIEEQGLVLLKYNLKFEAVHPQTEEELLIRYPVVIAFHKDSKIVEVRFDALKRYFMENTDGFYAQIVDNICTTIHESFGIQLSPLNLDFLIDKVQHEDAGVHLVAQTMQMANGTYAELQVDKNEDYILPFIGELKNLLVEQADEFAKVPLLKEAFEQFIFEKEATSDYPWIELLWEKEIKTRSIHVKFTFNYYKREYCLLQHYFNSVLIGMERMNHVVRFISDAR